MRDRIERRQPSLQLTLAYTCTLGLHHGHGALGGVGRAAECRRRKPAAVHAVVVRAQVKVC
jgi:hypothetical protein